jgi:hypothetical protein
MQWTHCFRTIQRLIKIKLPVRLAIHQIQHQMNAKIDEILICFFFLKIEATPHLHAILISCNK